MGLAPHIANLVLTNADEEYDLALPKDVRQVRIQTREGEPIRYCYEEGDVDTGSPSGPYLTLKENASRGFDFYPGQIADQLTFFFASDDAGTIVEVEYWS